MYSCFTDYLLAKAPYTEGELAKVAAVTYKRVVRKGEVLFEEGSQWPYNGFVCNGLIHNYTIDLSGKVKSLSFAPEMHWLGDRNSLLTGKPMPHSAKALEDSYIVYIENDDFEKLRIVIPRFNEMIHELIQRHIAVAQQRITQDMVLTDEERYAGFLKAKQALVSRVPPELIASYLNISPDSLDRIINGIPWKK
jgi:CRP-like cAMP-binding protein